MTVFRTFLIFIISSFSLTTFAAPPKGGGGANRNWYIDLSLAPVMRDQNDSIRFNEGGGSFAGEGSVSTAKTFGYDLKTTAAYAFNSTWLAGLSYNLYSTSTSRSAVAGGDSSKDSTTSINEYGPTFGALWSGWHFTFTYIFASEFKYKDKQTDASGTTTSDITATLKDGSGFIFNFGYSFDLTDWLQIGPSLIYRKVSYKKESRVNALDGSAAETFSDRPFSDKAVQGSLSPFLSLTARF